MSEITLFKARSEVDARRNMEAFIDYARRQLNIFGDDLDFDQNEWDVTGSVILKGRYDKVRLLFTVQKSTKSNKLFMKEPFLSFAKAAIRYQFALNPVKNVSNQLMALRALEEALVLSTDDADPTSIDGHILNRAAQICAGSMAASTAYTVGVQLEKLATLLRTNRLTSSLTIWNNPIPRSSDMNKVGEIFEKERAKKLPSPSALDALPRIFREATDVGDVITVSACAVLCSAPDRINELLLGRESCEVQVQGEDGKKKYGLRWWPAKGANAQIKWIVDAMAPVVQEALIKIRRITDEARSLAKWYEANPEKMYLPPHLEYLRNLEWLTLTEIGEMIFAQTVSVNSVRQWCSGNDVALQKLGSRGSGAKFADVEAAVLKLLPPGFPVMNEEIGLKYSEALFVCKRNALHVQKTTYRCMFEPISITNIASRLGRNDGGQTIFDKFGFYEPDGSRVYVTSHQFRHYLNTLAQASGLSQLDIAKWSGRKDLRQNDAYDHQSTEVLLMKIREVVTDDVRMKGPLSDYKPISIIRRDEFAKLKVATAHTTDLGYCIHDFVMSPCQLNRDCIRCDELYCIKGEKAKEAKVRQLLVEAERLVGLAEAAITNGEFGAKEWLAVHLEKTERLKSLIAVFDNTAVEEGAVVHQVASHMPTRIGNGNALSIHSMELRLLPTVPHK